MTAESILYGVIRPAVAALLVLAPQSEGIHVQHPITLAVERQGEQVQVRVEGRSDHAYAAMFDLSVVNGGNRSIHKGRAVLQPGTPVVLSTMRMHAAAGASWKVSLAVRPEQGESYTLEESGSASSGN